MTDAPRVFLSYSHDSDEHAARVLDLADALCRNGIDVIFDRYVNADPDEGWPRWMDQNIEAARFVLLVCTDTYRRRAMGLEEPGRGLGVDWEGNLMFNAIYHRIQNDQPSGSRFIPILLPGSEPSHIPNPFQGYSYYRLATFDLNTDRGYEALYRHLTNQPATPRPDLGPIQTLPPIPRPQAVPGPQPPSTTLDSPGDGTTRGTVIDLNGRWDGGSVISVAYTSITIDMSASNRPAAHGSIVDSTTITVTFPDDATYTGTLQPPNTIRWSNGTAWTKV